MLFVKPPVTEGGHKLRNPTKMHDQHPFRLAGMMLG